MRNFLGAILLACAGCGAAPQPESTRTVAAFEVPLPDDAERGAFLALLHREAETSGFHLAAATPEELRSASEVSPITLNATIWRDKGDTEIVASAMDYRDNLGRIWISFAKGQDPKRFDAFRHQVMQSVARRWPGTLSLPIMPTGAIPLPADLIRTPSGYIVDPAARAKYELQPSPPAPSSAAR
jgi:hypothetical protein